jgi:2-methylcitrate dehydratase PrpD
MFGTDTKTLHVGHHGRNGIVAGKLAKHNFGSCPAPIEAWARLVSTTVDTSLIGDLARGGPWQILTNAFKPYPCGIVIHPLIDACLEVFGSFSANGSVKDKEGPQDLNDLAEIQVTANPQLVRLCNVRHPRTGLETIFSLYHGCAVALVYGRATPAEFSDEVAANDPLVHSIRDRISVQTDSKLRDDEAYMTFTSSSRANSPQAHKTVYIKHATGSMRNPMTKAQLEEKFFNQTEKYLGKEKAIKVVETCRKLDSLEDVGDLAKLLATSQ